MIEKHIKRIIKDEVTGRLPKIRDNREKYSQEQYSKSDLKDDVARLFSNEPIIRPDPDEKRLLEGYYTEYMAFSRIMTISSTDRVPIKDAYQDYEGYKKSRLGSGSRRDYGEIGEKFEKAIRRKLGKKDRVQVVDFGAARCEFITGIREKFKDEGLNTTATSLRYSPHMPVDEYVISAFEWLPKKFENKFDVAVSNTALEYAILPHLTIRGISQALAPEGEAFLDIQGSQIMQIIYCMRSSGLKDLERQYLGYLNRKVPYKPLSSTGNPMKARINELVFNELEDISHKGYEVEVHGIKPGGEKLLNAGLGEICCNSRIFFAHIKKKNQDFI